MTTIASHRRKVRNLPDAGLFAVTLRCHDPDGEFCFLSLARNRGTLSSYSDAAIRQRVEQWTEGVPALAYQIV